MNPTAARIPELPKVRGHEHVVQCGMCQADLHAAAKQCYHCQGLGHVQADCPTLRLSGAGTGGRCYSCGQPGHLAVCGHFSLYDYNPD